MGHSLTNRLTPLLFALLPLTAAVAVILRQAQPFAVRSDDHSYYGIATRAAAASRAASAHGIGPALAAFFRTTSVKGEIPPHISRKRPLLPWVWTGAVLAAGDKGLVWTWRGCYLLVVVALFLVLAPRSSPAVAAMAATVYAVSPAVQGLLSWMSCSTYLVAYPLLLGGMWVLCGHRSRLATAAGLSMLVLAMLAREVAFLLVPTAVAMDVWRAGRRRLACAMPVLAAAVWLVLPGEDRSVLGTMLTDPALVARASLTVIMGHAASLMRNVGLLLVGASLVLIPRRKALSLAGVAAALLIPGLALWAPVALLAATARSRESLPGIVWAVVTVLSLCLYGTFTSRYAVEPLVGMALAVAPAIPRTAGNALTLSLSLLVAWQTALGLAPDTVQRWAPLRFVASSVDTRFEPLATVAAVREHDWVTFAGRAPEPWRVAHDWSVVSPEGIPQDRVSRSGPFMRLGSGVSLHCHQIDDVVFTRETMWEWNVWYWRVVPPRKGAGVHVEGADPWSVHAGTNFRGHARCLRVVPLSASPPLVHRRAAIDAWMKDAPEIMNPSRVRQWLNEVWESEKGCPEDRRRSSFVEQEVGRLLIRDDGWLDHGELAFLRRIRGREGEEGAPRGHHGTVR